MAQERTNFSAGRRKWLDDLKATKILELDTLENKEIFFLAIALGYASPKPLKGGESWIQCNVYTGKERALICSALLGKLCADGEDVNDSADFMKCNRYAEQCAEAGFDRLEKICRDNHNDNEEICAYLMNELDRLYDMNIAAEDM